MHFFTEQDLTGAETVCLEQDNAHHLIHVLRAHAGEKVEISDKCGRTYSCTLTDTAVGRAFLSVDSEIVRDRELPSRVTLYQGLPKGDKMALIIQKAVELGVSRIVPVLMSRSIARPDKKSAARKAERWQKIAESAAKQCGRAVIPEVTPVTGYEEALREASGEDRFILPYECAEGMDRSRRIFSELAQARGIAVMIGPEGGFDPAEVQKAGEAGAEIVTLGSRILRTETAGLTVLSWIVFQLDR